MPIEISLKNVNNTKKTFDWKRNVKNDSEKKKDKESARKRLEKRSLSVSLPSTVNGSIRVNNSPFLPRKEKFRRIFQKSRGGCSRNPLIRFSFF